MDTPCAILMSNFGKAWHLEKKFCYWMDGSKCFYNFHCLCHLYVTTDNTGRGGSVGRNYQCIDDRVEDLNGVSCSALGLRPLGIGRNNLCMGGRIENWKCPTCSSNFEASTICG